MTARLVYILGNSNCVAVDGTGSAPAGLPESDVKLVRRVGDSAATIFSDQTVADLDVTASSTPQCGCECKLGLDLIAGAWAGDPIVLIKIGINGSAVQEWGPAEANDYFKRIKIRSTLGRKVLIPDFKAYAMYIFGENERDDAGLAATFTDDLNTLHAALETWTGKSVYKVASRLRTGVGTQNATIRTQITAWADAIVNTDDIAVDTLGTYGGVDVHWLATGQNDVGARAAAAMLAAP